uniref:Uncharacterized protein n=1 Tax=Arundo donax TaxID=35708 RepID=A0A0A9E8X9_ARUDO
MPVAADRSNRFQIIYKVQLQFPPARTEAFRFESMLGKTKYTPYLQKRSMHMILRPAKHPETNSQHSVSHVRKQPSSR